MGMLHNVACAEAYLRTKWHLDPSSRLATTDMGRKLDGCASFLGTGAGSPSNRMSFGPWPTSLPSGILILAVVWPQQIWAENWGRTVSLWGGGTGSPSNSVARAEAYLRAKFHIDPSNRLAAIYKCYRQDRQRDRQRSNSTGRTVLQKVAQ